MLKILPIVLSRISQKIPLLFFLLFLYPAYYSIIILIQYISVVSCLVFISSFVRIINNHIWSILLTHHFFYP